MITVHHLEQSRSQRIIWLLEELGLSYDIAHYQRDRNTLLAPPSLKNLHPLGKAPVVEDNGTVYAESGAIFDHLLEAYPEHNLIPNDANGKRQFRYWMHYAEGSLMPLLVMTLVFQRIPKSPMPFFARPIAKKITGKVIGQYIQPQLDTHLAMINQHLADNTWLCGEFFSAADIQMSFPLLAAKARTTLADYPHVVRYITQLEAHPGYQKTIEIIGPLKSLSDS